jgi:hypothetical protein
VRALLTSIAGATFVLFAVGGRQGNISGGGTAHDRLIFWSSGLIELFRRPLYIPTGLGGGWFTDEFGLVAHNSFVQAYVEFGVLGGGAFLGAFALAVIMTYRLGRGIHAPAWAVDARHYVVALLVGYAIGCYSLTRNFVIPTYLTLGMASVLLNMAAPTLPEQFRVSENWFIRAILFSICGLLLLKFATQGMGQAGI